MSKKRYIDTKFWSDPWIVDDLEPLERYLMLYFITNEKTNVAGVYEMSLRTISNETGLTKDQTLEMLRKLKSRVVYQAGWVVLKNTIKHQNYKNVKIESGIMEVLAKCPAELLPLVKVPNDGKAIKAWIENHTTPVNQMTLDESSMTLEGTSHSNRDLIKLNRDSNSNGNPMTHAAHSYRPEISDVDKKLAAKEKAAKNRKPTTQASKSTLAVADVLFGGKEPDGDS